MTTEIAIESQGLSKRFGPIEAQRDTVSPFRLKVFRSGCYNLGILVTGRL